MHRVRHREDEANVGSSRAKQCIEYSTEPGMSFFPLVMSCHGSARARQLLATGGRMHCPPAGPQHPLVTSTGSRLIVEGHQAYRHAGRSGPILALPCHDGCN